MGLTFADYCAVDAVNWSTLRHMADSPLHYLHAVTTTREDTDAMRVGRAVHTSVLEPDRFPLEWTVYDGRRAGKAWDEFAAANAAKGILSVAEYERCLAIRDAVWAHEGAAEILRGCRYETSATWTDPATGLACKCRPDAVKPGVLADLKTAKSIDARKFQRSAWDLGYFGQLAFYAEGIRVETGEGVDPFIIAVESTPPHDVGVFRVEPISLAMATDAAMELLGRVAECRESGRWPGMYPEAQTLELPPWAFDAENDISGLGIAFGEVKA